MPIIGIVASSDRNIPNAPIIGTATDVGTSRTYTPQNGGATVTFTAPVYTGGLPILDYTATSSPGGFTATGASSPLTVNGLAPSTSYTFTVTARNSIGLSAPSNVSNSMTATTVPQAPTIGTATAGSGSATVAYTAGATGGKTINTFTATSSPGGFTGTGTSPITVSGLTNGTAYTFTVTATNNNGTSNASNASNSVTPALPKTSTVDYLVIAGGGNFAGNGNGGGGGGAGGYLTANSYGITTGSAITVTVGGAASNSQFSGITATAGGNGALVFSTAPTSGGSGGGGAAYSGSGTGGAGTSGQGYRGGNSANNDFGCVAGGGGAGGAGGDSSGNQQTVGGIGITSSFGGTSVARGGGGGSFSFNTSCPTGGGADYGGGRNGAAGTANTGGGASASNTGSSVSGGSGIVIIRYSNTFADAVATTGSPTFSNTGGYKIYQWTGSGSITF
jgi:hypothetical protein